MTDLARKSSTHKVEIVRIGEIERHPNADTLGIVRIFGYTCCVRLADFKAGDLAAYIVPDSVVPASKAFAFLGEHRRIRVKRLRGTISQGLLIKAPVGAAEGDDVAELLGVVQELRYGTRPGDPPRFLAFDVFDPVRHDWLPANQLGVDRVPPLHFGAYSEELVLELAKGNSLLAQHVREGIVIEPVNARRSDEIGRVKLKLVNDEYLERA